MGKHGHHGHHGHRHGGRGFRGGYMPLLVWELDCDPNSPLYQECLTRFHGDGPEVGGILDNAFSENIDAIRVQFSDATVHTAEAQKIKDDFIRWYDDLTWIGKGTPANYDLARNQRNRFNLANAVTPEDKAAVQSIIQTGISTEQLQNQPDRRDAGGMLPGPVVPPTPPLVPNSYLIAGAAIAGLAFVAWAYGEGRKVMP